MSIEQHNFSNDPHTSEQTSSLDVYETFAGILDLRRIGEMDVRRWLLANRVLHIDNPYGGARDIRVIVGETSRSERVSDNVSVYPGLTSEKINNNRDSVSHNYVYRKNSFFVVFTDGSNIMPLEVESSAGQHIGRIDTRGIDGKYEPNRELIRVTCLEDPYTRHTLVFNRQTGNGLVRFKDGKKDATQAWILDNEESHDIVEAELRSYAEKKRSLGIVPVADFRMAA